MKAACLLLCAVAAHAQLLTLTKEQMVKLTAKNPFERFEDGRPKVPDAALKKIKELSAEDVWTVLPAKGFPNHFAGDFKLTQPGKKLVGRVVTAQFMPVRGDLNEIITSEGKQKNYAGGQNQWIIDQLQAGDVLVVDLFGKDENGTFVGDNLAYYILKKTGTGLVVDGSVRDLEGIATFEDMPVYYRHSHPAPIRDVMITGFNVPIRVGGITVMPGDVILGDREGISIIPPQVVNDVITRGDETRVHDIWTKKKFDEGKYKSSDIYGSPRDPALKQEYETYKKQQLGK